MKKPIELTDDEILDELGVELEPEQTGGYTPLQERILAGFEDVVRFRETYGRPPEHGQQQDIFERIYAVRLDRLRKLPDSDLALLRPMDKYDLLSSRPTEPAVLDDDALLRELEGDLSAAEDLGTLRHVRSIEERRDAEQVADRFPCKDFEIFKPLFDAAQGDLEAGRRQAKPFQNDASIEQDDFFILSGQLVYVAFVGETFKAPNGENDARLRAIYANGTESNILRRSLARALNKDEKGRRLTAPDLGPLFGNAIEPDDLPSGTVYVLRSLSEQPEIKAIRDVLHKIGVTGGSVEARICHAEHSATYLLAPVEVVAEWRLANVHRFKFEQTIHRIFAPAQLQMRIADRFGVLVEPREWFVAPLSAIDEAIRRIQDETITDYIYDPKVARLRQILAARD